MLEHCVVDILNLVPPECQARSLPFGFPVLLNGSTGVLFLVILRGKGNHNGVCHSCGHQSLELKTRHRRRSFLGVPLRHGLYHHQSMCNSPSEWRDFVAAIPEAESFT